MAHSFHYVFPIATELQPRTGRRPLGPRSPTQLGGSGGMLRRPESQQKSMNRQDHEWCARFPRFRKTKHYVREVLGVAAAAPPGLAEGVEQATLKRGGTANHRLIAPRGPCLEQTRILVAVPLIGSPMKGRTWEYGIIARYVEHVVDWRSLRMEA